MIGVTELRLLVRYCEFGTRVDDEIKIQIKLKNVSSKLRRKAFAEPQWKLDDLIMNAQISDRQASEVENTSTYVNTEFDTDKTSTKAK